MWLNLFLFCGTSCNKFYVEVLLFILVLSYSSISCSIFYLEVSTFILNNFFIWSAASGEPPLLLAASVHCAARSAIGEARKQFLSWNYNDGNRDGFGTDFELPVPATMPVVKCLCGLNSVEKYLEGKICEKWRQTLIAASLERYLLTVHSTVVNKISYRGKVVLRCVFIHN